MTVDHRQILTVLDELMQPISSVKIPNETDNDDEQILTINLIFSNACDRFHQANQTLQIPITLSVTSPIYYQYIQIHLHLLQKLIELEQDHLSSHLPLFSIQDESILSRSLSFVILLGLTLHFDEGVSHSIESYLKNSTTTIHLLKLKKTLTHENRLIYLNDIVSCLMNYLKTYNQNLYVLQRLYSIYFLEIILSHLQLLYSPHLKTISNDVNLSSNIHQENLVYLQKHFSTLFLQQIFLLNRLLSTNIQSPMWLKHQCGNILTSILIDENNQGIRQILQTIVDSTTAVNDRLYVSMAKILSACPKSLQPDQYIQCIKYQLIELIHEPKFMPIICITINELFRKYPQIIEKEILSNIFNIFLLCRNPIDRQIYSEEQMNVFLDDLSNLLTIHSNDQLRIYIGETYWNELINLYLALERSCSSLKMKYSQILIQIFSSMTNEQLMNIFKKILFELHYLFLKYQTNDQAKFELIYEQTNENNLEIFSQSISKLLFSIENHSKLTVQIFLSFLQLLIIKPVEEKFLWTNNEKLQFEKQYLIMQILKSILEYLTEHMDIFVQNLDDIIRTIQIILDKITTTCQEKTKENFLINDDNEDLSSDDEALQLTFTIASLLITHYDQFSTENKQILASFYPSLVWIKEHHFSSEIRQLAEELSIAFITFGAIKDVSSKPTIKSNLLIEEIDSERNLRDETYENAIACLYDASLPIRAHGLILFRRLIERSDAKTLQNFSLNQKELFDRFQEHLHADDSYEYLAAINVFHALANHYTDIILPILCQEYQNVNRKLEDRLKVGEILVKTSRVLGDMSTKYSSLLINTFLYASKQLDDDLYRSSALSNLGQLCTVLKYSLSKHLVEILTALKSYLSIFESNEVRRASILVCELICQSLDQTTWLTILGNELPAFYHLISQLYKNDRDEIVRLHAQLALEGLNRISREFLQPPVILEKKIRILS